MIVFDLQCGNGHAFEGWFDDTACYEDQKAQGLIACPACNDTCVKKIPSTFAIKSTGANALKPPAPPGAEKAQLAKKLMDFVEKNFDNVGADFTKEALKIHYGASKPRNIRGSSSAEEEKILREEGVRFFKFPLPRASDTES